MPWWIYKMQCQWMNYNVFFAELAFHSVRSCGATVDYPLGVCLLQCFGYFDVICF